MSICRVTSRVQGDLIIGSYEIGRKISVCRVTSSVQGDSFTGSYKIGRKTLGCRVASSVQIPISYEEALH